MDEKTKQIFTLAEEIGDLLKETDEFRDFERASIELSRSKSEKELLERYAEIEDNIRQRRDAGDLIEPFVLEEAASFREAVMASEVIKAYLLSRDRYVALLELVQKELENESLG